MRWFFAPIVLLVLAISVFTIVALKGGESMSMSHNETVAVIGLPPSDKNLSGTFETATFALG